MNWGDFEMLKIKIISFKSKYFMLKYEIKPKLFNSKSNLIYIINYNKVI
jgi:hypothetical protein